MGLKRTVVWNVIWNWLGTATNIVAGFVVAPFLVRRLGEEVYGLWIIIGSFTGYFGLLDLGVRASVGRLLAIHRGRGDQEGVNTTLSTAIAVQSCFGAVVLVVTFAATWAFFALFDVPESQAAQTRTALLIVGANLALSFPLALFDSTLWSAQRFDLLNAIDIPATLVRVGLTFYLIGQGYSLPALALITLTIMVLGTGAKAILSYRTDPGLSIRPRNIRRNTIRSLFGYGVWDFLFNLTRLVGMRMGSLLVGAVLSVRFVTPYSVAQRLISYASTILMTAVGVLVPVAAALHASQQHDRQRRLFLEGSRYCVALTLFFMGCFTFLGSPLIRLWMGPELEYSWHYLMIVALGEFLPMAMWVAESIAFGIGKQRLRTIFGLLEVGLGVTLVFALKGRGLAGVCIGLAISGSMFRGFGTLFYVSRKLDVAMTRFVRHSLIPPLAAAALPALGLYLAVSWLPPRTWPQLIGIGLLYLLLHAAACLPLLGDERISALGGSLYGRFRGAAPRLAKEQCSDTDQPDPQGASRQPVASQNAPGSSQYG